MTTQTSSAITFDGGMARLREIADQLDGDDERLPAPDQMIALIREAHGIQRALNGFLETCKGELAALDDDSNFPRYEVVGFAKTQECERGGFAGPQSHEATPSDGSIAALEPGFGADDDIPF